MFVKNFLIFLLSTASIATASATSHWILFRQSISCGISIHEDGSAMILYGSHDKIEAPPGSFDIRKIDAELGPLVTTNPGLEKGVNVYSSLRTGTEVKDAYYTENIEYVRYLVKKVFEKSRVFQGNVESFDRWLEKRPPLGLELYFDEDQIIRREDYTGPPLRLRRPPSWLARLNKQYALSDKIHPAALELLATPWPYLALLVLLGMVVRRYRLKKRGC